MDSGLGVRIVYAECGVRGAGAGVGASVGSRCGCARRSVRCGCGVGDVSTGQIVGLL